MRGRERKREGKRGRERNEERTRLGKERITIVLVFYLRVLYR